MQYIQHSRIKISMKNYLEYYKWHFLLFIFPLKLSNKRKSIILIDRK